MISLWRIGVYGLPGFNFVRVLFSFNTLPSGQNLELLLRFALFFDVRPKLKARPPIWSFSQVSLRAVDPVGRAARLPQGAVNNSLG
jgi:hypothetical protein